MHCKQTIRRNNNFLTLLIQIIRSVHGDRESKPFRWNVIPSEISYFKKWINVFFFCSSVTKNTVTILRFGKMNEKKNLTSTCADEFVLDSSTILSVSIFIMFDVWIIVGIRAVLCMWIALSRSVRRLCCTIHSVCLCVMRARFHDIWCWWRILSADELTIWWCMWAAVVVVVFCLENLTVFLIFVSFALVHTSWNVRYIECF